MWTAPTALYQAGLYRDLATVDTVCIGIALDRFRSIRTDNHEFVVIARVMHFAANKAAAPLKKVNHGPRLA
jgi:hypothetical protein